MTTGGEPGGNGTIGDGVGGPGGTGGTGGPGSNRIGGGTCAKAAGALPNKSDAAVNNAKYFMEFLAFPALMK